MAGEHLNGNIDKLIADYISCAYYLCSVLMDNYSAGYDSILAAYRSKKIPREGIIDGIHFNFHGIRCFFQSDKFTIDIDFGFNDRFDGFDRERLYSFWKSCKKDIYPEFADKNYFLREFESLIHDQIIYQPLLPPSQHLYYLKS
jgi:hypothetical protein